MLERGYAQEATHNAESDVSNHGRVGKSKHLSLHKKIEKSSKLSEPPSSELQLSEAYSTQVNAEWRKKAI